MPEHRHRADPSSNVPPPVPGDGRFAETHWSMMLSAGKPEAPDAAAALEELCRTYWYPVYAWIRSRGYGPEDAKDLTQEFPAGLLRRGSLGRADPEKRRFRAFLIRSIQYFLTNHLRADIAAKRGGGRRIIKWDGLDPEQLGARTHGE